MPYSKHVGQPPTLDAANMVKGGTPAAQKFPAWKRWVGGEGEYDGKGLRDVVEANAHGMDQLKAGLDETRENFGVGFASLNQRMAAVEAQLANSPCPF